MGSVDHPLRPKQLELVVSVHHQLRAKANHALAERVDVVQLLKVAVGMNVGYQVGWRKAIPNSNSASRSG